MATQDRYPTPDDSATGTWTVFPASPATRYDKVDETPANDDTDYIYCTAVGRALFGFSAFSIPSGATINFLRITYRHKKVASQACSIRSALRVGGTNYDTTDPGINPTNGTWNTRTYDYTINPKTGAAWTVADINGSGTNPLQVFGLYVSDASPNPYCTQCFATVDYTPGDRRGQSSWAELEVPTAPRRGRVSFAEFESPNAPRQGRISWGELESPTAPRRGQLSWEEFEAPSAPRRGQLSFAELESPEPPRKGQLSWSELEIPGAARRGQVSWSEFEAETAPRRSKVSWNEFEVPDGARGSQISWTEFQTPDQVRRGQLSFSEFEISDAPRQGFVSYAELQVPDSIRRSQIAWLEFEIPSATGDRSLMVSSGSLEVPTKLYIRSFKILANLPHLAKERL